MLRIYVKNPAVPVEIPVTPTDGLELTFDDIVNVPVSDASSVSDWNTHFDLPTYGTPFTSVEVVGNMVKLIGGSGITLKGSLFDNSTHLISIDDKSGCVIQVDVYSFLDCIVLSNVSLNSVITFGYGVFENCNTMASISITSCENLGATVGNNDVFNFEGSTVTLTVPAALMTCNGGSPDGDIAYLQANNTVTIITV